MRFFKFIFFLIVIFGVFIVIMGALKNTPISSLNTGGEQKAEIGSSFMGNDKNISATSSVTVEIKEGLSRPEVSKIIGQALNWNDSDMADFISIYGQMQWAEFNIPFVSILTKKLKWKENQKEIFLTNSTKYFTRPELDFFGKLYIPGTYTIPKNFSFAQIAGLLIDKTKEVEAANINNFISDNLSSEEIANVDKFVRAEYELLPDLVPLPAQDVQIVKRDNKYLLLFTTVYYNQGRGPLELVADPKSKNLKKDVKRDVYQRIYSPDGNYRDRVAGKFLWHQAHLHYHFEDFILYDLEPVDVIGKAPDLRGDYQKSTFCIRDISTVILDLPNIEKTAQYEICGKEKQGISVGWGDAYFYNYPDQSLDITALPTGIYKLIFRSNPDKRFEESNFDNNESSVLLSINMEEHKVLVLESVPDKIPKFKHIHPVQENCTSCVL